MHHEKRIPNKANKSLSAPQVSN